MDEPKLLLEVWQEVEDCRTASALILGGPRGEQARQMLGPNARLVATIRASCRFEAMTATTG
jgi:hypothetical protein